MLEALEVLRALDRKLRLVGEAFEQTKLPVVEVALSGRDGESADPVAFEPQWSDHETGDPLLVDSVDMGDHVRLEHEGLGATLEPLVGELAGEPAAARRIDVRRIAVRGTSNEIAGRHVFLDPQRCALGAEHARGHLDAPRQHIVGRLRRRKLAARLEQRVGDLGGLGLLAVQPGLLQRHRGLVGKRRQEPLPVLVECGRREHQAAFDPVALGELGGGARR